MGSLVACGGDDEGGDAANAVQLNDGDDGREVTLAKDGSLTVVLESNPSTGFTWTVKSLPDVLRPGGEPDYIPPVTPSPAVGAAGKQRFTFTATKSGSGKLELIYSRSFERGVPPAKTFSVSVTVK